MGCNSSRVDGLPAVAMCRDRCKFVDEAFRQSYAMADAHATHMHSLKALGPALSRFFQPQLQHNNCCISEPEPEPEAHDTDNESQFFNPTRYDSSPLNHMLSPLPSTASPLDWDFFNFFEAFDNYQLPYDTVVEDEKKKKKDQKEPLTSTEQCNSASPKGFSEAIKEIQILFERASDSGNPILEMLDVGKLRYHSNIAVKPVPCKIMHVFTPSKPIDCMQSSLLGGTTYQGVDVDKGPAYGNLCSTLHKQCMWEEKLYAEVKAEEKLRILHENKCRQLRRMNKKGADAHKVDSVQILIEILATKIKFLSK